MKGVALGACGALLAFVLAALPRAEGVEAAFAACAAALALAAAAGPFVYEPRVRGLLGCAAIGVLAAIACAGAAAIRHAPVVPAALAGLACGVYAATLGAVADLAGTVIGARVARTLAACVGIALLGTFLYWDDLFLLRAADRKASAAAAFTWNAAAAASTTLGFDWLHAKALYTGNETAESLLGVTRPGVGAFSLKCLVLGSGAGSLAWLLRRRRRA